MIPYDDLVAALSQWRARQGLPVNTIGGSGSGGTKTAGSGPNKAAAAPPPHHEEEVMEAEEYDPYAEDGDATQHGSAPERPTDADMSRGGGGGGGRDDW